MLEERTLVAESESPVVVRPVDSEQDQALWHKIGEDPGAGSMHQCFWWAQPLRAVGVETDGLGFWKDDRLLGGALFRSIPVPVVGGHVTQCLSGPLNANWRPRWADGFVSELERLAERRGSLEVALSGCRSADFHRDVLAELRRRGARVSLRPGVVDASLPLERAALPDALKAMNEGTRRNIKKAQKSGVELRLLTRAEELKDAHGAWLATASRKGFSDVRPWEYLEPVVRRCVDHGHGAVLGSFKDGRLLAAIFVTFLGGEGSYVYGGYRDGGESLSPNHILHLEAIKLCLDRGLRAYNFGALSADYEARPTGTDRYKLGFGARPVPQLDTIVWRRRPWLCAGSEWLKRQSFGRAVIGALKRRLLRG